MKAREKPAGLAPAPWPDVPSSDPIGEIARQFVLNVTAEMDGRSVRSMARDADIHHVSLTRVLAGAVWPDLVIIAKLEKSTGVALWPGGQK